MAEASKIPASENRARVLPSGTVAFLFTDIEGSTQRWDQNRDAMDDAVKRHDVIVRKAIERREGYVFKTVGDAFCASFAGAPSAVAAAIDIQRDLANEDFVSVGGVRVRTGLHAGDASERDGDYFGPAVNRTARLMSIGHGGQILLSGIMRELAESAFPAGASIVDLGMRRLKDLTEPEHVWQLSIEGLRQEFPALASLDARPNNLPAQLTRLIGRDEEVDEMKELVAKRRLVTLLGSGGVGKTRLALQVGADLIDQYPNGVWFADLAPIRDPELVPSVIAQSLGMTQAQDRRVDEALMTWLQRKHLLLILDNCEHLVETVARLADGIVRSCPDVSILATSRQALGIDGEMEHRIPSLSLPESDPTMHVGVAMQFGAIALFVERAAAADTRFQLTDVTAPIVADICRRLDGIPLALELAAARVRILSIPNLAKRLDDRFKILTGGSRTSLPRQKTLTAMIDWSYDLLTPQEQTLLARVAIFAGGFDLDAATSVCAGNGVDENDVLDLLSSLTDKSLIVADTTNDRERFRLLESTRAYATEKLTARDDPQRLARSHAEYFRRHAEAADENYFTSPSVAWLAREEIELDNYRSALEWSLTDGRDVPLGAAIAGSLERIWLLAGLIVEGRYWISRAQSGLKESTHPVEAARLWLTLSGLSHAKPKHDAAERALALYDSCSDPHGTSWAVFCLAFALFQMGRLDEAKRESDRTLAAMIQRGDQRGIASCLNLQGLIGRSLGVEVGVVRDQFLQAIEIYKSVGNEFGAATMLGNLAEIEFLAEHIERALSFVSEALDMMKKGKNALSLAIHNTNLAAYCIAAGDLEAARAAAREGLKWAMQCQHTLGIAIVLQHFALIGALRDDVENAARLVGFIDERFRILAYEREYTERWCLNKLIAALRERLTQPEIDRLAAEGAAWTEDYAVALAMTL